jgi:hypothetical protein
VKRYLYPTFVVAAALAVAITAAVMGGRSAVFFLALAAGLIGWIAGLAVRAAQALVREPAAADGAVVTGRRRKELEREKQALLKALKELDFDHQMGKVSAKDFAEIRAQYRARAIRVMRQLDASGRDYESMIAQEVQKRLRPSSGAESRPATAPESETVDPHACGKCKTKNDADAEFCKNCGLKLGAAAEAAS